MDPFVLQLIIIPFLAFAIGIVLTIATKNIIAAPILTLALNVTYESMYHYILNYSFSLSSWNIILPLISLFTAYLTLTVLNQPTDEL
ncbi:hypothetical protein HNQ94_001105 [Salirhabdus euzebyi]|uniref:Uncharacterized protein n=1 Tax=Salirhabdus euzebyi TaxID=394506 RepID=A0A841PUW4_9BACI|nr:hypothetical protein [Salirhabdus euzebyi]MBB6452659.1 hypothetical protein [Salirhabdus euzebyi]